MSCVEHGSGRSARGHPSEQQEAGDSFETWERLQARLYHLGYLGEELSEVVATSPATRAWLYREP
ncbi:MAG: hypothetical protein ACRDTE_12725 [Pseudonocardiaceae bacterium]